MNEILFLILKLFIAVIISAALTLIMYLTTTKPVQEIPDELKEKVFRRDDLIHEAIGITIVTTAILLALWK